MCINDFLEILVCSYEYKKSFSLEHALLVPKDFLILTLLHEQNFQQFSRNESLNLALFKLPWLRFYSLIANSMKLCHKCMHPIWVMAFVPCCDGNDCKLADR